MLIFTILVTSRLYFEEKYGKKYLILDSTEKYKEVFSGIKSKIETINGRKEMFY